jgi:predicted DCC family thiol-disulfide oxidoreductase YuxK
MPTLPAPRPVVIFDGDCGICTTLAGVIERWLRPPAAVLPWQRLDLTAYGLTDEACTGALQYVDADGTVYAAELAVARLLRASRPWARPAGFVIELPGVRFVAGAVYRWVARNRSRLPGGTAACAVPPAGRRA